MQKILDQKCVVFCEKVERASAYLNLFEASFVSVKLITSITELRKFGSEMNKGRTILFIISSLENWEDSKVSRVLLKEHYFSIPLVRLLNPGLPYEKWSQRKSEILRKHIFPMFDILSTEVGELVSFLEILPNLFLNYNDQYLLKYEKFGIGLFRDSVLNCYIQRSNLVQTDLAEIMDCKQAKISKIIGLKSADVRPNDSRFSLDGWFRLSKKLDTHPARLIFGPLYNNG